MEMMTSQPATAAAMTASLKTPTIEDPVPRVSTPSSFFGISAMDRIRKTLGRRASAGYEPLHDRSEEGEDGGSASKTEFSRVEYSVFLLLGISMLWAWNMFLAASPYFQRRFRSSPWILTHFASAIISVSTITNLLVMLVLAQLQRHASYPWRITASLVLNICAFTLLALSTVFFRSVSPGVYFAFLMVVVLTASVACALCQNGAFAYVAGFGKSEYTQGIMAGQAVAGVLPCVAQIVSVLSVPEVNAEEAVGQESPKSAFAYFLTATVVSALILAAFSVLVKRHEGSKVAGVDEAERDEGSERKVVALWTLFRKLRWLALAVALTFAATMLFPVYTQKILSVRPAEHAPRLLRPACFIPLAFLFWNAGDLLGRLLTLVPGLARAVNHPTLVFVLALLRLGFIPLYMLCNIRGRGAVVPSDAFYLLVVQLLFGVSSGFIGSTCMMGASRWVDAEEREAAGGFMGLMLCGGLTVGSLLSFLAA